MPRSGWIEADDDDDEWNLHTIVQSAMNNVCLPAIGINY